MKQIDALNYGKGKMIRMVSHSAPQHGWLACKRSLLVELGLLDKVTPFSYQKGNTVYLEEDCDAGLLINKLNELNRSYKIVRGAWYNSSHRIRNYEGFKK